MGNAVDGLRPIRSLPEMTINALCRERVRHWTKTHLFNIPHPRDTLITYFWSTFCPALIKIGSPTMLRKSPLAMTTSAAIFGLCVAALALVVGVSGIFLLSPMLMATSMWPGTLLVGSADSSLVVSVACWGIFGFLLGLVYQVVRHRSA